MSPAKELIRNIDTSKFEHRINQPTSQSDLPRQQRLSFFGMIIRCRGGVVRWIGRQAPWYSFFTCESAFRPLAKGIPTLTQSTTTPRRVSELGTRVEGTAGPVATAHIAADIETICLNMEQHTGPEQWNEFGEHLTKDLSEDLSPSQSSETKVPRNVLAKQVRILHRLLGHQGVCVLFAES